jgi:hypothetical protein
MLRTILAVTALGLGSVSSAWALKIFDQPENAVELALAGLTLPNADSGAVKYRTCETCQVESLPFDTDTKYLLDGRELAREDFAKAIGSPAFRSAAATTYVTIYFDKSSQHVNRIAVTRAR